MMLYVKEWIRKLFDVMKQLSTSVRLMYIDNDRFTLRASRRPEEVPVIQGTRTLHQINCVGKYNEHQRQLGSNQACGV